MNPSSPMKLSKSEFPSESISLSQLCNFAHLTAHICCPRCTAYTDSTVEQNGLDCNCCSESSVRLLQLRRPKTETQWIGKGIESHWSFKYLIFVTNITNAICGEQICCVEKFQIYLHDKCREIWKNSHLSSEEISDFSTWQIWRNLKFIHICHVEIFPMSPHDRRGEFRNLHL